MAELTVAVIRRAAGSSDDAGRAILIVVAELRRGARRYASVIKLQYS
jgi:hypothetical protein